MSWTNVNLLNLCGAMDVLLEFFISPVTENSPSTGTDNAFGVRKFFAKKLNLGYTRSFLFQNNNGLNFSTIVILNGPMYDVISLITPHTGSLPVPGVTVIDEDEVEVSSLWRV